MAVPESHVPWSEAALDLVAKRYLAGANITIDEWLHRVVGHICSRYPETDRQFWSEQYLRLISSRTFLPTSAALYNSLRGKGSLAGCMVLPLPSKTTDILQKAIPQILGVLLDGTGVGIDLSVLPPRLWEDSSTDRACPGPVELLSSLVLAADGVMAYAGFKRAAYMASLLVSHPDIFEFIVVKRDRLLRGANISVSVDIFFHEALTRDGWLPLSWNEGNGRIYLTRLMLEDMM